VRARSALGETLSTKSSFVTMRSEYPP